MNVELDAGFDEPGERLVGERVDSDRADHPHACAEPRGGDRLVRALAAGKALERSPRDRLPRPRQPRDACDEVEVDRADDRQFGSHGPSLCPAKGAMSNVSGKQDGV